jgi:hypothetical protein
MMHVLGFWFSSFHVLEASLDICFKLEYILLVLFPTLPGTPPRINFYRVLELPILYLRRTLIGTFR